MKVLEEFKADGRARSIGVSNFQVAHLERLAAEADVVPAVNQIELHPYFLNDEVRRHGEEHGIATEAWSPIAQGDVLDDRWSPASPSGSAGRRRRWCSAGTSSATASCSRSPSRPGAWRRTSSSSTSSSSRATWRRSRGSTGARAAAVANPDTFAAIRRNGNFPLALASSGA